MSKILHAILLLRAKYMTTLPASLIQGLTIYVSHEHTSSFNVGNKTFSEQLYPLVCKEMGCILSSSF